MCFFMPLMVKLQQKEISFCCCKKKYTSKFISQPTQKKNCTVTISWRDQCLLSLAFLSESDTKRENVLNKDE